MCKGHCRSYERALFSVIVLFLAGPALAQQTGNAGVIWQDRGDAAALDLRAGPGGQIHEPGTTLRFVKESVSGTSPKFEVEDEHGVTWMVKVGEEARSETAATRLLWAAGYVVDEDYYRPEIHVEGLPHLARGQQFVLPGNIVTGARLERQTEKTTTWSWYENPFLGTREFNGLRVMMAIINNWDLKDINNGATDLASGGGVYGITDLGATFGRTGNSLGRSKAVVKDYAASQFIEKVTPTYVDFVMHSRPFFLSVFNFRNYRFRTQMESVVKHIPIGDAIWLGDRLGQLSTAQIGDSFRAAGFSPADVDTNTRVVMQRIAALKKLDPNQRELLADSGTTERTPVATDDTPKRCLESTCRNVPLRETLTAIKLKTPYARAIVGGFEQGAGIGGGVQLTSANAIRAVEFRAAALTSIQRYRRFDLEAFVPRLGSSRNHADAWFSAVRRETDFFGIGPRTPDVKTHFAIERRSYQGSLYRDLATHFQGGVYAQIMSSETSPGTNASDTPIDERFSSTPGNPVAPWIPGFVSTVQVLSYGGFFAYDTRDDSIGLTRGVNIYGRASSAEGLARREVKAGDYGWFEQEFDVRGYIPLGSPRTSLLLRSRAQFKNPKGDSQIPFYDLSWLGGREYLRGYHSYRFRGNNVLLLSTELQQTVYALTGVRGIDVFASSDAGQVWGDGRASTDAVVLENQNFSSRNWHSGLGGGVQYRHSRRLAARVEVGRSHEGSEVYLSMSRGF